MRAAVAAALCQIKPPNANVNDAFFAPTCCLGPHDEGDLCGLLARALELKTPLIRTVTFRYDKVETVYLGSPIATASQLDFPHRTCMLVTESKALMTNCSVEQSRGEGG